MDRLNPSSQETVGIVVAMVLILVALVVLPSHSRRLVRVPSAFLAVHLVSRVLLLLLTPGSTEERITLLFSLVLLFASVGRWSELADQIRRELPFEAALTTAPGDATRLARQAVEAGAEIVVAVGGDGTINEVANGFFDLGGQRLDSSCALGVLPFGTGGDFVRNVKTLIDLVRQVGEVAPEPATRQAAGKSRHCPGRAG